MAKGGLNAGMAAKKKKKPEPMNVILMNPSGRIRQYRVHARTLRLFFLFLLVFVVVSVLAINRYQRLYMENQDLRARLDRLEKATVVTPQKKTVTPERFDVERSYRLLAAEVDKVDNKQGEEPADQVESQSLVTQPISEETKQELATAEEPQAEETEAADAVAPPSNPLVDATNLVLRSQNGNSAMRFKYRLSNVTPDNTAVSGYLFLVLENAKAETDQLVAYPEVELQAGQPTDYKKGTIFKINNLKDVEGVVYKLKDADNYNRAWVYAFSEEGELMLKKLLQTENG